MKALLVWLVAGLLTLAWWGLLAKAVIFCAAGFGGPVLPFTPVFIGLLLLDVLVLRRLGHK